MRFAAEIWLWGVLCALLLGLVFVAQGLRLARSRAAFGHEERVRELITSKTAGRRAVSAVLGCLAVAFAFLAAAQPQYGRGTRVLPATNLDVVLVLDFSKSMYARDVSPSRIGRAKVEVARLVRELAGARFGAVAFAGESISFPLTSDGAAIAQFFRGLEPNDMPLGGTAIARALEAGRQLMDRDPLSKGHERVLILITDGEDLEGDPVEVARSIREAGMRVEVVQIGGQSPEPIPDVDAEGVMRGLRRDAQGQIMTTALSPEGEAQLAGVASEGGGQVVRATVGQVGIDEMSARLRRLMTEELSERVETVYADVFQYPLAVAVLLLMIEVWVGTAPRRVVMPEPARGAPRHRRLKRLEGGAVVLVLFNLGCGDVDRIFERKAPAVEAAIAALRQGKHDEATKALIQYLETGPCEAGVIGVGDRARRYADASYDLALSFAQTSEPQARAKQDPTVALSQGQIPGQSQGQPPAQVSPGASAEANPDVDCALRLLAPLGPNLALPTALRARSLYLAGNLELGRAQFEPAVSYYDQAILLAPGVEEKGGDPVGALIAYNRALALRLLKEEEEKKKQQQDESSKEQQSDDQQQGAGDDEDQKPPGDDADQKPPEQEPKEPEDDSKGSGQKDEGDQGQPQQQEPEPGEPDQPQAGDQRQDPASDEENPNSKREQASRAPETQPKGGEQERDERMLDLLEQAPTLQQHEAQKGRVQGVRGRVTMEDK